jgi:hypothetical protein
MTPRTDGWNPNPADADDNDNDDALMRDAARMRDGDATTREHRSRAGSPGPTAMTEAGATSWQDIKSRFVDDPEDAVAAAEELVRLAVEQRIRAHKDEMEALLAQRDDDGSSTEARRTRLIRYQEYCERLAETAAH